MIVVVSHARSSLELTRYDLSTLRPGEWLNDECMNMYMALLQVRVHVHVCPCVGWGGVHMNMHIETGNTCGRRQCG